MFFYYRPNNKVVMRSEKRIQSNLTVLEYTPTLAETDLITQNYEMEVQDGKLNFKEPEYVIDKNRKLKTEEIKNKINSATTIAQIKDILKDLL